MEHSRILGFDDAPFDRDHSGAVPVVGVLFVDSRVDGILVTKVERDGSDSSCALALAASTGRFAGQAQLLMIHGITLAGFNVVDLEELHAKTGIPVLVVVRKQPNLKKIRTALLEKVTGGSQKWALIEKAGLVEPCAGLYVQRCGLDLAEAEAAIKQSALNGILPEPLRLAHMIGGAMVTGQSRGRP